MKQNKRPFLKSNVINSFNGEKFGWTIHIINSEILLQKEFLERCSDERFIEVVKLKILEYEKAIECLRNCV